MGDRALELSDRFVLGIDRIVHGAFAETHDTTVIKTDIVMEVSP